MNLTFWAGIGVGAISTLVVIAAAVGVVAFVLL